MITSFSLLSHSILSLLNSIFSIPVSLSSQFAVNSTSLVLTASPDKLTLGFVSSIFSTLYDASLLFSYLSTTFACTTPLLIKCNIVGFSVSIHSSLFTSSFTSPLYIL